MEHLLIIKGTQEQLRAIEKSLSLRVKRTPGMETELQSFPDDDEIPASGNDVDEAAALQAEKDALAAQEQSNAIAELEALEAENKAIEAAAAAKLASEKEAEVKAPKTPKPPAKTK